MAMSKNKVRSNGRVIALLDMDCFYVQVMQRLNPKYCGKPVIVVQHSTGKHAGILAVSYEARMFGIIRGRTTLTEAKMKCPTLKVFYVPSIGEKGDLSIFRSCSEEVFDVLIGSCHLLNSVIERASIDECFIDLTVPVERIMNSAFDEGYFNSHFMKSLISDCELNVKEARLVFLANSLDQPFLLTEYAEKLFISSSTKMNSCQFRFLSLLIASDIMHNVLRDLFLKTSLTASCGVACNKTLAKLVSSLNKPNKLTVLLPEGIDPLLERTQVSSIRGLGGKLGSDLCKRFKIKMIPQVLQIDFISLRDAYDKKTVDWLLQIGEGIDLEPVKSKSLVKSISTGKNFVGKSVITSKETLMHWVDILSQDLVKRSKEDSKKNNRKARTLVISLSFCKKKKVDAIDDESGKRCRQPACLSLQTNFPDLSKSFRTQYISQLAYNSAIKLCSKSHQSLSIGNITLTLKHFEMQTSEMSQSCGNTFIGSATISSGPSTSTSLRANKSDLERVHEASAYVQAFKSLFSNINPEKTSTCHNESYAQIKNKRPHAPLHPLSSDDFMQTYFSQKAQNGAKSTSSITFQSNSRKKQTKISSYFK